MKFRTLLLTLILLTVLLVALLLSFDEFVPATMSPQIQGQFLTIVVTAYIGAVSFLLRKNADVLEVTLNYFRGRACRILLYGSGGSGKTAIINNSLYDGKVKQLSATKVAYEFHNGIGKLEKEGSNIPVIIADFMGQDDSLFKTDQPASFFGTRYNRLVNAIVFVVDLFPSNSQLDEKTKDEIKVLEDDEILAIYNKRSTPAKIKERLLEHERFLEKSRLIEIYTLTLSKNLLKVVFAVNKMDLFRRIVELGYTEISISNKVVDAKIEDYVKEVFAPIIAEAKTQFEYVCKRDGIDIDVNDVFLTEPFLISAKKGDNMKNLRSEIYTAYVKKVLHKVV